MIVTITALKGGVGKTTTAIHLSAYLQTLAPTLLIDADKNRSALVWSKEEKLPFVVASAAGAPGLTRKFEHIVIDTKARPEIEDLKDFAQSSDLLIIPTTPNPLDIDATIKAIELIASLEIAYKVLLTKVDTRTRNGRDARSLLESLNLPLFSTDIPQLVAFERAPMRGTIVRDSGEPRARVGWKKYEAVGREIVQSTAQPLTAR